MKKVMTIAAMMLLAVMGLSACTTTDRHARDGWRSIICKQAHTWIREY